MSKRSFAAGVLLGAGSVIGLLAFLFFAMPYVYLYTENSNFARLRKKSELHCETMPLHCLVRDDKTAEIEKYAERGGKLGYTVFERIRMHDHIDEEIGRLFVK